MSEPCDLSAVEARRLIGLKKLSPVELLESCLDRIEATNGAVNAFVALDPDGARVSAKAAEQAVMIGDDLGLLHGLPIGIKDLEEAAGIRTTFGSLLYKDHVPDADNATTASIRSEGAVILGKTNSPEFGAGGNTTNRVYGATGNPFDPSKTCGGSSGGSAVALALNQVPLATGSDYGGSLRTPSGFCGVVGFRPSAGLVPSETRPAALTPFSVSGPMGRTVADAHLLLKAQIDINKADPFSSDDCLKIPEQLSGVDLGSLRVALSTDLGCVPIDAGIAATFKERAEIFSGVFAEASHLNPDLDGVHEVFEVMRGLAFVAAHGERLEKHRDLLGPNVIDNTERGMKYSLPDVARAHVAQTKLYRRYLEFFEDIDILICPAASVSPFPHDQLFVDTINGEKLPNYMRWLSLSYALTTVMSCVACLPCGTDQHGMPFGIQVVGPNGSDAAVLEVAYSLEQVLASDPATSRPVPDLAKLAT